MNDQTSVRDSANKWLPRLLLIGLAATQLTPGLASAASPATPLEAVQAFADAYNKDDAIAGKALFYDGPVSIIDGFDKCLWIGLTAPADWWQTQSTFAKTHQMNALNLVFGKPVTNLLYGNVAYVVVPDIYTFSINGTKMRETSEWTFVLEHQSAGWKIEAATYAFHNNTVPVTP